MVNPNPPPAGMGQLEPDGAFTTLVFRRRIQHAPALVWEAITNPEDLKQWLMCSAARVDARKGGRVEMVSGPGQYHSQGDILAWDPPHLLEYQWIVPPVPEMPAGEDAIFRYELAPLEDGGTALTVTYRRITRQTATGFAPGLHALLDRLEAQLSGHPLPDWMQRFSVLQPHYPAWRG